MSDVQSSISNFASRAEELLSTLRQTDGAEAALKQQSSYVADLQNELSQLVARIRVLEDKTQIEKSEFEKYRDSNIKRFAYKLGGSKGKEKFQSKTEKEEKEYYEALEEERAAKDRKQSLDQALQEGIGHRDTYQRDSDTYNRAQKELDDLYNMVFAGPTPSYPQEDQSEWQFTQAREHFNAVQQQHKAMSQALDIFVEARQHMHTAAMEMDSARGASQWDMFGGGTFADMAERSALSRAESAAYQTKSLIAQAARCYPEGVRDIPHFEVAQGHIMSDMMFDNIFTDMAFHDKIKASQAQILQVQQNVEEQAKGLKHRLDGHKQELDAAQARLTDARKQLQDMRTQIFMQAGGQQPPPYQS